MSRWQKKPVTIEAFQWTGGPDQEEDPEWIIEAIEAGNVFFSNSGSPEIQLHIKTLEGEMTAQRGDWIIQGVQGELYPCKPDIFEASYRPALESVGGQPK